MTSQELFLGQVIMRPDYFYEMEVRPSDFTSAKCRRVFEIIGTILDRGESVDFATIMVEWPEVDGTWLASLTDEVTPNVKRLAEAVIDEGRRHRLHILAREVVERVQSEPVATVLEHLETGLSGISEGRDDDVRHVKGEVLPMVQEFERRYKSKGVLPGIASSIRDLDEVTLGWGESRYIVVGARPSEGKSALLLNFATAAASKGIPAGVISIESSRHEFLERAFCNIGGIDGYSLRTGNFPASRMTDINNAAMQIHEMPLYVADKPNMQISELKSRARRMVRVHGCKVILVDYIQLIQVPGSGNDYERVSAASIALKALSRELNVPIIAAAQLNRGSEEGKMRKPRLADFKNSGQIEQDADTAILIYRRERDGHEETWLCVEKNRDGVTKDVQVYFDKPRMRFTAHEGRDM